MSEFKSNFKEQKSKNKIKFDPSLTEEQSEQKDEQPEASKPKQKSTVNKRTAPAKSNKSNKNTFIVAGLLSLALLAGGFFVSGSGQQATPVANKNILAAGYTTELNVGTVLSTQEETTAQKDYVIEHNFQGETTNIYVWDYAAEDGDYVQILVNGQPLTEPFMIYNAPKVISVPATGEIQIKGVRDGGGGITYAVHYELNKTTYFNNAPIDGQNTYTLSRK